MAEDSDSEDSRLFNDEDEEIETSEDGRWRKMNKPITDKMMSVENAYAAYDTDDGFMVVWNEIYFTDKRTKNRTEQRKHEEKLRSKFGMLKEIQHQNIVKFHDFWFDNGPPGCTKQGRRLVYITELVTAGTLKFYLKKNKKTRRPLQPKVLERWSIQILSALRYLHSCDPKISHGELNSSTVFIQHNGLIKIGPVCLDDIHVHVKTVKFGAANAGTMGWEYFAPEVIEETEHTDEQKCSVDIYAFGITLLEMATLCSPYAECQSFDEIRTRKVSGADPECLASVSNPILKDFITKCIAPVAQRKTADELLYHPWLFRVPTLRQLAAHALVSFNASRFESTSDPEDYDDAFSQEVERHTSATLAHDASCTHTRGCKCTSAHIVQKSKGTCNPIKIDTTGILTTPGIVSLKHVSVGEVERFLDEVRNGFHTLIHMRGHKPKPVVKSAEQEKKRIVDVITVTCTEAPADESKSLGREYTVKYRLGIEDDEAHVLTRSLGFWLAEDTRNFGEHAAGLMVKHGLLNEDDTLQMIEAINAAELIHHA